MRFLFVMHDPPYGSERVYNGLRWATELVRRDGTDVKVYLFGDSVVSVMDNQTTPQGYYNVGKMMSSFARHGGLVGYCRSCLVARGLPEDLLNKDAERATLADLADWTQWADKVINV